MPSSPADGSNVLLPVLDIPAEWTSLLDMPSPVVDISNAASGFANGRGHECLRVVDDAVNATVWARAKVAGGPFRSGPTGLMQDTAGGGGCRPYRVVAAGDSILFANLEQSNISSLRGLVPL